MANLRVDKITSTETFETTGSVQFDGTNDYLTIPDSSDFEFGDGDFTIEAWVYFNNHTDYASIIHQYGSTNASKTWFFSLDGTAQSNPDRVRFWIYYNSGASSLNLNGESITYKTWHHVAAVRHGNKVTLYQNGVATASSPFSETASNGTANVSIGADSNAGYDMNGHISNVRVLKGTALYTANFKPPMRELEVVPGTSLLACQSKTDASLEKTGKTITVNGNAVASELTPGILTPVPKAGAGSAITGSVEFDGTEDYLSLSSNDFAFGTGDFTLEFWFNSGDVSDTTQRGFLQISDTTGGLKTSYTNGLMIQLGANNSGTGVSGAIHSLIDNSRIGSSGEVIKTNSWNHCVVSRESGVARIFLNGNLLESKTISGSISGTNLAIGGYYSTSFLLKGFISNLRVVKGTALYTDDFIPPTRELKKVPGTVLLCCQDPDSPLTEATGKTITGYGDLQKADGVELVSNGSFIDGTTGWTAQNAAISVSSEQLTVDDSANAGSYSSANQNVTTEKGKIYLLKVDIVSTTGTPSIAVYHDGWSAQAGNVFYSTYSTTGTKYAFFTNNSSTTSTISIQTSGTTSTVYDNVSLTLAETRNGASNFTPQVGDDRKVTFEGVTKINTENYFYLPTGDTVTRDSRSGRGVFAGGLGAPSPLNLNVIDYVSISSMGNAFDFGDLTAVRRAVTGLGNQTRGIIAGGVDSAIVNTIEFLTIATTGNTQTFGELTDERRGTGACASNTRGIIAGGKDNASPSNLLNTVDYITIASLGDAASFGELNFKSVLQAGVSSPTRGVFAGGYTPTPITSIDFITIASTGNGTDFGDLITTRYGLGGVASPIRGVFAGGYTPGAYTDVMEYITIASTGSAQDFGDTSPTQGLWAGASNGSRGIFAGGNTPSRTNGIQYVTISTTGDAQDFGDLIEDREQLAGLSDSHGGLG
jgi:hypothetical protein